MNYLLAAFDHLTYYLFTKSQQDKIPSNWKNLSIHLARNQMTQEDYNVWYVWYNMKKYFENFEGKKN